MTPDSLNLLKLLRPMTSVYKKKGEIINYNNYKYGEEYGIL